MRSLSLDLKARIPILRFKQDLSVQEICKVLGLKKSFVYKYLKYYQLEHSRHYNYSHGTGRRRMLSQEDIEYIQGVLAHRGTLYLDELQTSIKLQRGIVVSIPTLSRTLRRLQVSRKHVSRQAVERSDLLRAAYMNCVGALVPDMNMIMFTDESARDGRTQNRPYGWARKGEWCYLRVHFI